MTLIVNPNKYPSKKAFKEAVASNPDNVVIEAPGLHPSSEGGYLTTVLQKHDPIVVTNHPKRSWFASITIATKGKFKGQIRVT